MHEVMNQLLSYLRGIWQHRWQAIIFAWIFAIIGWTVVYFMPNRYEASARVYVDTQTILKPLLSGLAVQPNIDQQVMMMSRTLISRPNVEKVIRMTDMDHNVKTNEEKERLIDRLISQIEIKSTGHDNLYTISYRDTKPAVATRVVQSLLSIFVEGSLGDKRKDADSAQRFIDEQIKLNEQKLITAETALKEFKRKNVGLMPGQGNDYYSRVTQITTALDQAKLELREAEFGREAIKNQLSGNDPGLTSTASDTNSPKRDIEVRIQDQKKQLDTARLYNTDKHPDVIALSRALQRLEEQKAEEEKTRKPGAAGGYQNPVFQQLRVSLAESEANIASLKVRVAEYETRYKQLKATSNAVPQVEADFSQLNRDYEVTKLNYEKLIARRDSAKISGDADAFSGMMDFRIIDPPRAPSVPSSPNRPLLMLLVLLGSIAAGIAIAFLISQIRPSFNDRRTLQEVAGLPLLGNVSLIWTESLKWKHKRGTLAFTLSFLGLLGSYGAIMAILFMTSRMT